MPNPSKKKKVFIFIASLAVMVFVGYFFWSAVASVGGDFINKVLSYTDKIGAKIFTASIPINYAGGDVTFEPEEILTVSADETESQNPVIAEPESVQDQLDDIQEKLDVISVKVQELIAEQNSGEKITDENKDKLPGEEKDQDKKQEDRQDVNKIIYPKILISGVQISPIEQRFIKLYNPNNLAVDLTGWYLQRKTQSSDTFESLVSSTKFQGKIIMPSGYFFISRADPLANIILDNLTLTDNNTLVLKDPNGEISDTAYTIAETPGQGGGGGGSAPAVYPKILISEVQVDPITQRFFELYNPNSADIDLSGWYIFRNNSSFVTKSMMFGKTISANGYFLISRSDISADILSPDLTITQNNYFSLKNPSGDIVDKVGFGGAADFELLATTSPSSGQSIGRKVLDDGTEQDTDNNSADFEIDAPTPKFQNIKWSEPILPELMSIEITTSPTKLDYIVGDKLDISGLVVTGTYSDGSTKVEPITSKNVSGFDGSKPVVSQILTINFEGKTIIYEINIVAPLPVAQLKITSPVQEILRLFLP